MSPIKVQLINKSGNPAPAYATMQSAGMDVRAHLPEGSLTLAPGERRLIPTGLYMAIPEGYECQVRPRSGLALKHGVTVLNTPGTIDADYRGEVGIILINLGQSPFEIADGERIAQLVFAPCIQVGFEVVESLPSTDRGEGGFGHSGTK